MSAIKIYWSTHQEDCDDCGGYEDILVTVTENGASIYEGFQGGHFGDGVHLEDPVIFAQELLKALGHTVEISYGS